MVSADDFGLTRSITDGILAAYDDGCLSGTSVIAGGDDFDHALEEWRRRPALQLTAHLNLMEGRPLAPRHEVETLLDSRGEMGLSFLKLLAMSMQLRGAARDRVRTQIRRELGEQIRAIAAAAGPHWRPRVDGHQHYHMIPLVLEALLELHEEWNFEYVRIPEEPLFWPSPLRSAFPHYLGPNLSKHALLRLLGGRARREFSRRGIPHCRWFVGLLYSGQMTVGAVRAAVAHLERLQGSNGRDELVEILLHPGRATGSETARWSERPELRDYYVSTWRDKEREALCSAEFREIVDRHLLHRAPGAGPDDNGDVS